MPYQPATYSPLLHRHLHIEDYRLGRASRLREAADLRRRLGAMPAGSIPFRSILTQLRYTQKRLADLRSISVMARRDAQMERDLASVPSPSAEDFAAEAAASDRRAA